MRGSGSFIHKTGSTLFFDRLIVLSYAKTCPIFLHLDLFQFSPSSSLAFFFLLNKTCDVVRHLSRQGLSPVLRPFVLEDDLLR